jgi:hypothetical protein
MTIFQEILEIRQPGDYATCHGRSPTKAYTVISICSLRTCTEIMPTIPHIPQKMGKLDL